MNIPGSQVKTLRLQILYDKKLDSATYDALKAFQLNTINSSTSDLSNSKLRDIEASANVFFTSIANNFNVDGYNKDILNDYVPALVYTMYDGYYIYSPYNNTIDDSNRNLVDGVDQGSDKQILQNNPEATYQDGERLVGLKPYIYYSCRYKPNANSDFVITYSLDNYITIQGEIDGKQIYDYGYVSDNITPLGTNDVSYRGVKIDNTPTIKEQVYNPDVNSIENYDYMKLNGVKYYKENSSNECFSILNGEKYKQGQMNATKSPAVQYYKEAYEFTNRLLNDYHLSDLKSGDAVDEQGNKIVNGVGGVNYNIFDHTNKSLEDHDSNFNQQRLEVIRYSIEKNLSIAIANYNDYSGVKADFRMPKLKEDEWDQIVDNVSVISFLQGLNIGGKIYNGYSIITNYKNEEVVKEDSIYIVTGDNQYHRPNDEDLKNNTTDIKEGYLNIDFERKNVYNTNGQIIYYYPQTELGCYSSIVAQNTVTSTNNYYQYMAGLNSVNSKLASAYFTALGRERYGMYKTNNTAENMKNKFGITN